MNKKLRVTEIFAILLGAIIGWGCFMLPGEKFLPNSGVINTSIGLFLGTMSIIVIERSYRFMMQQNINEGGEFSYILKFLGKKNAFIVGWFLALAYISLIPLNAIAFPLVFDKLSPGCLDFCYLYNIAGQDIYLGHILVSLIIILFFMYFNIRGVKQSGTVQFVIISALVVCSIIVVIGMLCTADLDKFYNGYISNYKFDFSEIAQVFAITPFLFIGFDAIPQLVNDMNISRRKASNIALITLVIGMSTYILLNFATALAFTPEELSGVKWALGEGVMRYLGYGGFILLIIALAGAVSGGINGFMICSSKLLSSMSKAEILPAFLQKTGKRNTNIYIILIVSLIGFIACFFGRNVVIWIVDMCSFGAAITYLYVCLTTIKLTKKTSERVYAILGALFSLLFCCLLIIPGSPAFLSRYALIFLAVWIGIGLIFFVRMLIKERKLNSVKNA